MKKIIGYGMIVMVFIGIFIAIAQIMPLELVILIFGLTFVLSGIVIFAIKLISEE